MTRDLQGKDESGRMHTMTRKKALAAALSALAVALVCAWGTVGCDRGKPAPDPSSPESYMKDPEFRGKVDSLAKKRNSLMGEYRRLGEELDAAKKAGDETKAKDLEGRMEACKAEYDAIRGEQLRTVRERLAPKGRKPLKEGR